MPSDYLNTTKNRSLDFELDAMRRKLSRVTPASGGTPVNLTTVYSADSFIEPLADSAIEDVSYLKHFLMGGPF